MEPKFSEVEEAFFRKGEQLEPTHHLEPTWLQRLLGSTPWPALAEPVWFDPDDYDELIYEIDYGYEMAA